MTSGVGERALKDLRTVRVLHPMVLSIIPLLGLYAQNASVTPLSALLRPALYLVVASILLWIGFWIVLRNRYRAGLVASTLILSLVVLWGVFEDLIHRVVFLRVFWLPQTFNLLYIIVVSVGIGYFAYVFRKNRAALKGLIATLVPVAIVGFLVATFLLAPVFGRRAAWLITAYLVLTAFAVLGVLRYRGDFRVATRSANWFGGILMALYGGVILYNYVPLPEVNPVPLPVSARPDGSAASFPDIYFIVLDGYARSDMLGSEFGYNNLGFETALRDLGFQFAAASRSNYTMLAYSLTSCLNLDYLDALVSPADWEGASSEIVLGLYRNNRIFDFLHSQGYEIITFSPGLHSLELTEPYVDTALAPPQAPSQFELVLADRTVLSRAMETVYYVRYQNPAYWPHSFRRSRVLYAVEEMARRAAERYPRPRFFFAQLLIPEPPFLFTRDGQRAQPYGPGSLAIHQRFRGDQALFRAAYLDQLFFTNRLIQDLVRRILEESKRPVVIVLVSSRGAPVIQESGRVGPEQSSANLVAARFPATAVKEDSDLYPTISLVNVLRVMLNRVFDAGLPLLDDRTVNVESTPPFQAEAATS